MASVQALAILHRYRQITILQEVAYCTLYLHDETTDVGEVCLPPHILQPLLGSAIPLRQVVSYCTNELMRLQRELENFFGPTRVAECLTQPSGMAEVQFW